MKKRNLWLFILVLITLPMIAAIFQNGFTTVPGPLFTVNGANPTLRLNNTSAAANTRLFDISDTGGTLQVLWNRDDLGAVNLLSSWTPTGDFTVLSNLASIHGVAYTWPSVQGASGTTLTNNGSGGLGWGTASGGTSSPTNTPILLTLGGTGGTNVAGMDFSLGSSSGTTFKLILTTNAFFGTSSFSNLPTTNGQQNALLYIIQDATGTHTVTWTNSFGFVNGVAPVQTTNAGALDCYSLFNSLQTNNLVMVVPANNLHN
jgi:hypothetical protein